jgi:hypothetical protein
MMNKRRLIFLSVFGGYHLLALLFTIYMDSQKQDFGLLSKMLANISLFKYGAFFGLILFGTEAFWAWRDQKNADKEKEAMRHENNVLKAKVYDLSRGAASAVKPNVASK